jgi:hypothetical protein
LSVGVLGEEGENGLAPLASARHVVLFDERVVSEVGDRVKVEVERLSVEGLGRAEPLDPVPEERGDRSPAEPGRVLGHVRGLGHGIEPGGQRDAFIEHQVHDVTAAALAEQLHEQGGADGMRRGDHLGAGEAALFDEAVEAEAGQDRQKKEESSGVGGEGARCEGEGPHVGNGIGVSPWMARAFIISPTRKASEAF